jgi:hypothetical protein
LSLSASSQVIKKVDGERVVVFTLQQAKNVNDTFNYQRAEIERLKNIKPVVKIDTIEKIIYIKDKPKEGFMFYEGVAFMIVQAIIMIPTLFPLLK